jgi:hypothetical protein
VQVTLDIVNALIEKCPEDLNLFAQNIVNILAEVVSGNDILLVKHTNQVFDTFCKNHDLTLFRGDPSYVVAFQSLVSQYVKLATGSSTNPRPDEIQWRLVGIEASKSITMSVVLSTVVGTTFIPEIIPILLANLSTIRKENGLVELNSKIVILDSNQQANRRQSIHLDTAVPLDLNPDQQLLYKSLQTLRHIVETTSTNILKMATRAVLEFILEHNSSTAWASELLEVIAIWVPVQTRFAVLTELVDELVILPITNIPNQMVVIRLITSLLSSNVTMIGLSVIDILRTLLQHEYHLLQSGEPQPALEQLVEALKESIVSLSLHSRYASQTSDMIAEILMKCKYPGKSVVTPGTNTIDSSVTDAFLVHNLEIIYKMMLLAPKNKGSVEPSQLSISSWNGSQNLLNHANPTVKAEYAKALTLFLARNVTEFDSKVRLSNDFNAVDGSCFGRLLIELYTLVTEATSGVSDYKIAIQILDSFILNLGDHGLVRAVAFTLAIEDNADKLLFENAKPAALEGRDLIEGLALKSISLMLIKKIALELEMNRLADFAINEIEKRKDLGVWYDLNKTNLSFNTDNLSKLMPVVITDLAKHDSVNSLYSIIRTILVKQDPQQHLLQQENVDPLILSKIVLEADFTGSATMAGEGLMLPSIAYSILQQPNGNGPAAMGDSTTAFASSGGNHGMTRAKSLNQLHQRYQAGGSIRGVPAEPSGIASTAGSIWSGGNNTNGNGIAEESVDDRGSEIGNRCATDASKEAQLQLPTVRDLKRAVSGMSMRSTYLRGIKGSDAVTSITEPPTRKPGMDAAKGKINVSNFLDTLDVDELGPENRFV